MPEQNEPGWTPTPPIEVPEEEKEPTALDLLNADIQAAHDKWVREKNIWAHVWELELIAERDHWYTPEGDALPVQPPDDGPVVQFSPDEAVNAEGEWVCVPTGVGPDVMPYWIHNAQVQPLKGIRLSQSRSNGAFLVMNEVETSDRWINRAREVAEEYENCSLRIVQVAGYFMRRWHALPATTRANTYGHIGYALQPEIPFNEAEKVNWSDAFAKLHFNIAPPPNDMSFNDLIYRATPQDPWLKVDPVSKTHKLPTIPDHPNWIMPGMLVRYNTAMFKTIAYKAALYLVHDIDAGRHARVPGYLKPDSAEVGGEDTKEWRAEHESVQRPPKFRWGSDKP